MLWSWGILLATLCGVSAPARAELSPDLKTLPALAKLYATGPSPRAHWFSEKQIQLHYASFRPSQDLRFELISDAPLMSLELPLLSHRGDLWNLSAEALPGTLTEWAKRPLWVRILDAAGREQFRTSVRLTGLLDQHFFDPKRPVGLRWLNTSQFELRLWAPTASLVELLVYDTATGPATQTLAMNVEPQGYWSFHGYREFDRKYYVFRVTRFNPRTGRVETVDSADPASLNVSAEALRSQFVNLNDPDLMPIGWAQLQKPRLDKVTDATVYEMHLRDHTSDDPGIPEAERGTYVGLVNPKSRAFQHLRDLASAGLTHVHFLPLMDFAGVPEHVAKRARPRIPSGETPASPTPQERLGEVREIDAYNWGYNPVLWMVPEGSYSRHPDGPDRIRELREMIQGLNRAGLRVVLDVVYNHTYSAYEEDHSIFDRVVPYYYHRYNERGELMSSSCCADVATENRMVEKLMIESLIGLAKDYKVDGFRFDLMNLHPTLQVPRIREALDAMTLQNSGVEGSKLLVYGEAWPFGSLEEVVPGSAFNQLRSHGLGVGVFNDRMRDALRGGTTSPSEKSDPGFATGLFWDPNHEPANRNTPTDPEGQRRKLLHLQDVVKIGLGGNLRDLVIRDQHNNAVRAGDYFFRGAPVGYAAEPTETISYVSAHDGYGLWDTVQAKMPFQAWGRRPATANVDERVRVARLMLGTVLLSQGIPFFEGGSELLRSKSGDADSYDSGDHFNQIDWSGASNNWGVGLPPAWKNVNDWNFWRPRLLDASLRVGANEIQGTNEYFKALLRLRRDSPLLRLSSANEIRRLLSFPANELSGSDTAGLIGMLIEDAEPAVDPTRKSLLVLINAGTQSLDFQNARLKNRAWSFPAVFGPAVDRDLVKARWEAASGLFSVPARSILVLEEKR